MLFCMIGPRVSRMVYICFYLGDETTDSVSERNYFIGLTLSVTVIWLAAKACFISTHWFLKMEASFWWNLIVLFIIKTRWQSI